MSGDVVLYSFEDTNSESDGTYTTQNFRKAEKYAARYRLRLIANIYVWDDSEVVLDFTDREETNATDEKVTV